VTFLGATPERLATTRGRASGPSAIRRLRAPRRGPRCGRPAAAALLASDKDREEHAVGRGHAARTSSGPSWSAWRSPRTGDLALRDVQHLLTPIEGTLRERTGLLALGARLHPTPAVAGQPREAALDLIAEHEGFERGWYAGPIGWLGADDDGELMVALRCGLVAGQQATLFAGCGIVADSDPSRGGRSPASSCGRSSSALGRLREDGR